MELQNDVSLRRLMSQFRHAILCAAILLSIGFQSYGGVSYELFFGVLRDASGNPLPNGTVIALVADTNEDGLPGNLDGSDITVNGLDASAAFADFQGVELSVGQPTNGGDQIFYVGQIDGGLGAGTFYDPAGLSYPGVYPPGLATGQNFGIYWFPGITTPGSTLGTGTFEIGGFFNPDPNTNQSTIGMVLDSDTSGAVHKIYQADSATAPEIGGNSPITESAFSAIFVGPSADDFATWIAGFFPGETNPAIIGFDADPDGDGLSNGVESILGTAPDIPTQGLHSPISVSGALVFFTTLAKSPPSDVERTWEWSPDMVRWFPDGTGDGSTVVKFTEIVVEKGNRVRNQMEIIAAPATPATPILFVRLVANRRK